MDSKHIISTREEPSALYEEATNYVAECTCGWSRERASAKNRELAINLHREHAAHGS